MLWCSWRAIFLISDSRASNGDLDKSLWSPVIQKLLGRLLRVDTGFYHIFIVYICNIRHSLSVNWNDSRLVNLPALLLWRTLILEGPVGSFPTGADWLSILLGQVLRMCSSGYVYLWLRNVDTFCGLKCKLDSIFFISTLPIATFPRL